MRFKKVYILVLKSYLGPLVLTFFIALFVLLMQFVWKWIDELVGKGLEWYIITELLFYASTTFVPMALPLAILLSSLMTFGNLGEKYELVAMKAAGISLRRIMKPLVILSIIMSIGAFLFSNYVLPVANLKFKSILYDVRQQKLALNIEEGIYYDGIEGYSLRVGKKEKDEKTIRDVMIYDHSEKKGNTNLTVADSGKMFVTPDDRFLILTLYNGINYDDKTNIRDHREDNFRRSEFREQFRRFDLSGFSMERTNEELFKNNYHMLNIKQLRESQDSIKSQIESKREDFIRNFPGNYFYLSKKYDTTKSVGIIADTVILWEDDVLSSFKEEERNALVESALSTARNIKTNISYHEDYFGSKERLIRKHNIEWHRKFTLSAACLILFFIGAPLGAIIRKGGLGLPLVISILFFLFYHILTTMGYKYAKEGVMDPGAGMWLASVVFLPVGIFLTLKATTDAPVFDADVWKKFLNKYFSGFRMMLKKNNCVTATKINKS